MTLAVLCSGQGGQHAAMFDLIEAEGLAAPLIARASDCARFDVVAAARSSASESMFANAIAQPLICAYQGIVWSLLDPRLEAAGAPMAMVAGYSVGELASHGCARSLSWADVIALSRVRAAAMDAATGDDDGLVAVRGLPRAVVDPIVDACGVHVAIVNGDDQFVVGGRVDELESFASRVVAAGATAQRLPVRVAAHTPLLSRAVPEFREALSKPPVERSARDRSSPASTDRSCATRPRRSTRWRARSRPRSAGRPAWTRSRSVARASVSSSVREARSRG